jgi:two-component system response regulator HydG
MAVNFIEGPVVAESVLRAINQVFAGSGGEGEQSGPLRETGLGGIITRSPKMLQILGLIARLSDVDSTVLITGETGVGKELVAQAIHFAGARRKGPFVAINCGAVTESLLESELFGHERGSFTGAFKTKAGKFECAHKGTLFLDEIGEISPTMQVKLLRALQERKVERVGGVHPIDVDVRVIAATNQNIRDKISSHEFRIDLFYRLNVIPIHVPPLRERPEDIPLLVKYFINCNNEALHRRVKNVTPRVLRQLMDYSWPGNVRELENVVERAIITSDSDILDEFSMHPYTENQAPAPQTETQWIVNPDIPFSVARSRVLKDFEKAYLIAALKQCEGNVSQAAQRTGINLRTLWRKMKEYRLDRMSFTEKS